MKNKFKWFGIIALIAIMGFAMAGCDWLFGEAEPDNPNNPGNLEPGDFTSPTGIEMVWIKDGTFWMGSPEDEPGRVNMAAYVSEGSSSYNIPPETRHIVTLREGFYMGKYPVTQKQWKAVMGRTQEEHQRLKGQQGYLVESDIDFDFGRGDNYPIYFVTWYEAIRFCNKLSMMEGLSPAYIFRGSTNPSDWGDNGYGEWGNNSGYPGWLPKIVDGSNGYRLPTDAQWEYACRAGTSTAYYTGAEFSDDIGWYGDWYGYTGGPLGNTYSLNGKAYEVGQKTPNAWGLYDMAGNVWEWCGSPFSDFRSNPRIDFEWYSDASYSILSLEKAARSYRIDIRGEMVLRGGGWGSDKKFLRSAARIAGSIDRSYSRGFRLVRPGSPESGSAGTGSGPTPPLGEIEMELIPAGTFTMGMDGLRSQFWATPLHQVTLSQGFEMGKYPVTQEQYHAVMGQNPSKFQGAAYPPAVGEAQEKRPVEYVSWYDAIVFCNKLSMAKGLTPAYRISGETDPAKWGAVPRSSNAAWDAVAIVSGSTGYRLPTEAQWEYACKRNTGTGWQTGLQDRAWYAPDAGMGTHEVGKKTPNEWGLYDMQGNVWEWCWDRYGSSVSAYPSEAQTDPSGSDSGTWRIRRGGSWFNPSSLIYEDSDVGGLPSTTVYKQYLNPAYRGGISNENLRGNEPYNEPYYERHNHTGFRVVKPL